MMVLFQRKLTYEDRKKDRARDGERHFDRQHTTVFRISSSLPMTLRNVV